eukprot:UN21445
MKRHLCVSCSHNYRADRKKHHYSGVYRGSKFMHFDKSCAKMSQNHTSNLDKVFLNVHRVQILDWKPGFCKSADFIGQNEKSRKISIKK